MSRDPQRITEYVPRILRDDGMVEFFDIAHYGHLSLTRYVKVDDVVRWLKDSALHAKKMSEQHMADGVYTQARSWEGEWHGLECLIGIMESKP